MTHAREQVRVGPGAATREDDVNSVVLRGRLSGTPERRELPSGDAIVVARLVVHRRQEKGSRVTHDTFDLSAWRAVAARSLLRADDGDIIEVEGRLRRRFWRAGGRPASRYEIEVLRLRRLRRPR